MFSLVFFPSLGFPDLGFALRLVSTLLVLPDDVEFSRVPESPTDFVFTVVLTRLSELSNLASPGAVVVFLEAPLWPPFCSLGVRFFADASEDRLFLWLVLASSLLPPPRFFFGVSSWLEVRVDAARLLLHPGVALSVGPTMFFPFDDSGFALANFLIGARGSAFSAECASSVVITSCRTFRLSLVFLRVVGPAIDVTRSPDELGTRSGEWPTGSLAPAAAPRRGLPPLLRSGSFKS